MASAAPPTVAPRAPRGAPGAARLAFGRCGAKTVLTTAFAASPLRLLAPRNHGDAAWVFLATLGGGLVDGDRLEVGIDVGSGATALIATQASTKVYRSPSGCAQRLSARVADGAALAVLPDPVVCFAGARYAQQVDVELAPDASLMLLDGYTCGRGARGERWKFSRYASRTTVTRRGERAVVDATRLEPAHGSIVRRMGRFEVVLSLLVLGPRFEPVRDALVGQAFAAGASGGVIASASPLGADGVVARVAAEHFEQASHAFRSSFIRLARLLGDDPFARKW